MVSPGALFCSVVWYMRSRGLVELKYADRHVNVELCMLEHGIELSRRDRSLTDRHAFRCS